MAQIGRRNSLLIVREAPPGLYLDGGEHGEVLLPGRYITMDAVPGKTIDVFVYRDSEDRLVATTEEPYAQVGEFAYLRVVGVNPRVGTFLDWGLEKDLLLPAREQTKPLNTGDWVVVHVGLDERTDRIVASMRLNRHFSASFPEYAEGQPVKLLIYGDTPLGYNAVVNHLHRGLLYRNDIPGELAVGQALDGFVRVVRPDGKIDLGLDRVGYRRIGPLSEQIIESLKAAGGRMPFNDESTPEEIRAAFGVSKKAFKQAIGALYRDRKILIESHGIRLC
ncbi:MAG TPA: S1-like domain-containing RNA-binding protein [Opitutaceae bacterium]|nr:S1-like domain-containing RNA-binding protein [Opitutaceae bacterium]